MRVETYVSLDSTLQSYRAAHPDSCMKQGSIHTPGDGIYPIAGIPAYKIARYASPGTAGLRTSAMTLRPPLDLHTKH
jgi:hypothetical protein